MGYFDFFGIESAKDDINNTSLGFITNEYREKGMPNHLVVIEHNGDYVTCIDTSKSEGEIVSWSWLDNDGIVKYSNTFEVYFIEKLKDCLYGFSLISKPNFQSYREIESTHELIRNQSKLV